MLVTRGIERRSDYTNTHRGPGTVNFNIGSKDGYSADIYSGRVYEDRKNELAEAAIDLTIRSGLFTPPVVRQLIAGGVERINEGQDRGIIQDASLIFFRESDTPRDRLDRAVGFSWQEIDVHNFAGAELFVLYLRLRAFEERHRTRHLGRSSIELALNTHREASWIIHRTGSAAAARSFMETGVTGDMPYGIFVPGRRFPWDRRYDADSRCDSTPQQLLLATHFRVRIRGKEVNMSTGVSRGDYPEENRAFKLNPNHSPTVEIDRIMREELRMDLANGDSLIAMGELA